MMTFKGFSNQKTHLTPVPEQFFSELLLQIDDLAELKLTFYLFWRLDHLVGDFRYLRRSDFIQDSLFMSSLANDPDSSIEFLDTALDQAVVRGTLLAVSMAGESAGDRLYFLNSPKGRAAVQAIQQGEWRPEQAPDTISTLRLEKTNIFRLYEENIGPLTPIIADALGEAEDTYPASWIEEAFQIAVKRNARNWRYIEAILKRWQEEGRDAREDRRDSEETGQKYIKGELSDYIQH
jgi:DNA replication protein